MDKEQALQIAKSIGTDCYGNWRIPYSPVRCNRKGIDMITGEEVTILMEDAVPEWIDYVIQLIEEA